MKIKLINDLLLVWKILDRRLKTRFLFLCLISTLSMLLEIISVGTLIPFLSLVLNPQNADDISIFIYIEELLKLDITSLNKVSLTVCYILTVIAASFGRLYTLWFKEDLNARFAIFLKKLSLRNIFNLDYSSDLISDTASLMSVITLKIDVIIRSIFNPIISSITSLIFVIGLFATAVYLMPALIIIFLLILLPILLIGAGMTRNFLRRNGAIFAERQTNLTRITRGILSNLREFFIVPQAKVTIYKQFTKIVSDLDEARRNNFLLIGSPRIILEALVLIIISVALSALSTNEISLPVIAAFILTIQKMLPHIQQIYQSSAALHGSEGVFQDSLPLMVPTISEEELNPSCYNMNFQKKLELRVSLNQEVGNQITPKYSLSLEINKGDKVAIVGSTGSGKSSLIDSLMGLRANYYGTLFVDGRCILSGEVLKSWRSCVSQVPQKPLIFNGSVLENISFGSDIETVNFDRVTKCAEVACIHSRIEKLEKGYATLLSDDASVLSGGEIQRIAVARALYQNKPILIMDEVTSSLDPNTSKTLMRNILKHKETQTILCVTHDFDLLPFFDRVILAEELGVVREVQKDEMKDLENLLS
ncbi:ABC transporter ATP-binding protein/permease [Paracoccaceae bacterium]|nr:ABC transporter ATP-binding protein/permease [Paracoccaceae bacterium]